MVYLTDGLLKRWTKYNMKDRAVSKDCPIFVFKVNEMQKK